MNIEGIVTLTFVDAKTGEVLEVREEKNIFTAMGFREIMDGDHILHTSYDTVKIMTGPVADEVLMKSDHDQDFYIGGTLEGGYPVVTAETPSTPIMAEWRYRFTEPGAGAGTRTIYGVQFGHDLSAVEDNNYWAYTKLTPPCTQGELVVLFVNYRIQVFESSTGTGIVGFTRSSDMREIIMRSFMRDYAGRPFASGTLWHEPIPDGYAYSGWAGSTSSNSFTQQGGTGDNTKLYKFWKSRFVHDLTKSSSIGVMFGSHHFGSASSGDTPNFRMCAWGPATPPSFPNKPIQPIHNHSASAYNPFLEVTNLASGNGAFAVDGSGWTDPDFPTLGHVAITATGDVGVSTYYYRKRRHVGFLPYRDHSSPTFANSTGYECDVYGVVPGLSNYYQDRGKETFPGGHGINPHGNMEEWFDPTTPTDVGRAVVWNYDSGPDDGITLLSLIDGTYDYFDSTTTPALPVTDVRQVAVDDAGSIFVACATTGLWRIEDPRGTGSGPTVTKMTAAMGLPDDTKCYAVAQGYADSIWCIVPGGLCKTVNPTAPSPTFTTPTFVWTTNGGISNGNWAEVRCLRVDRQSSDNEMGIMYVNQSALGTNRAYWCWWDESLGGGNALDGSFSDYVLVSSGGLAYVGGFRCSRYGRLWAFEYQVTGFTSAAAYVKRYGTTTQDNLYAASSGTNVSTRGVCFFYDNYNKPFLMGRGVGDTDAVHGMWDGYTSPLQTEFFMGNLHAAAGHKFSFERPELRVGGMYVMLGTYIERDWTWSGNTGIRNGQYSWDYRWDCPTPNTHHGGGYAAGDNFDKNDSLNGKYSVLHEIMWENYRWNGASWVLNWNQAATEVSGFAPPVTFDGVRQNFETEDHTFYGRQRIDITPAFPPTLWGPPGTGAAFTFACQVTPLPKQASQELPRTLWSYYDPATGFSYVLLWDDGGGTTVLFENGAPIPFGPTPVDGVPYNVVLVITDGGGPPGFAELFVNGASVAGPVPLFAPVVDLFNAGGVAESYIGSGREDMSSWDYAETYYFSGAIDNVILDPFPWSIGGGEVPAHHGAPFAFPGVATQARWPLALGAGAVPLVESKATHLAAEALPDGLLINFSDGTSSPAFVDTDFYTFGICDGILKDNATSFRTEFDLFWKPVDYDFTDIEDTLNAPGPGDPTISASGGYILETVVWRDESRVNQGVPGQISIRTSGNNVGIGDSFQSVTGDGYMEYKVSSHAQGMSCGFDDFAGGSWSAYFTFDGTDTYSVRYEGTQKATGTYTAEDTFKVERSGTDFLFYHNGGLVWTENSITGSELWVRYGSANASSRRNTCIYDVVIYWNRPGYVLDLGKSGTSSGKYNADYLACDELPEAMEFKLNAVDATTIASDYINRNNAGSWSLPGPGEVLVIPDAGLAYFNAADVGKTVTCKYILIRNK